MATTFWVDNKLGNDGNDGKLVADGGTGPWKTLAKASSVSSYGAASTPWTINIVDNGWSWSISGSDAGLAWSGRILAVRLALRSPGTAILHPWYRRLRSSGWVGREWPGTANVYYAALATSVAMGLYGWSDNFADDSNGLQRQTLPCL